MMRTMKLAAALLAVAATTVVTAHAAGPALTAPGEGALVRPVPSEAGAEPNRHPATLPADALRGLLQRLAVRGAAGKPEPLFTADEAGRLAGPLAQALAAAGPGEDIGFALEDRRGRASLLEGPTATAGRVFVSADGLNLVLGRVHYPAAQERKAFGWERPLELGRRAGMVDAAHPLVTDAALGDSLRRADWLVLPLARLAALPAEPWPATEAGKAPATAKDAVAARVGKVEARLQVLDELRRKGSIDEAEYRAARREVLLQQ